MARRACEPTCASNRSRRALSAFALVATAMGACYSRIDATSGAPSGAPSADASAATDAPDDASARLPDGGTCPNDRPDACPSPPPSYAADVSPILERRCLACHGGDGLTKFDFTGYDSVYARRSAVLNQIFACKMPPIDAGDAGALEPEEREILLAWLVCRAPNN